MPRLGGMYGPDVTFLGVNRCDLEQPSTLEGGTWDSIPATLLEGR